MSTPLHATQAKATAGEIVTGFSLFFGLRCTLFSALMPVRPKINLELSLAQHCFKINLFNIIHMNNLEMFS